MADDDTVTDTVPNAGEETVHHAPPPVPETHESHDDLKESVRKIEETVNGLVSTVASLAEQGQDSSPVKKPWTSRKLWA